jgi:hypothetical protein
VKRGDTSIVEAAMARHLGCVPCWYHHDTNPMDDGGLKHGGSIWLRGVPSQVWL